jgi:hypothetical protein
MSIEQRLNRLAPVLTAQERAILILEAWKAGRPEDPAWRRSMPQAQVPAFNQYIELMNRANVVLGRLIGAIAMQTEALEQREMWLVDMVLWEEHVEEIRRAIRLAVREPITESEYAAANQAARDEWVSVTEMAAFLAGEREEWPEDDYETVDGEYGPVIKDEAWDRGVAEEERKLRAMVARGELPSRGKGKRLELQQGVLSHFGHEVGAVSEDYLSYRVVRDEEAEEVESERKALRHLQRVLEFLPYDLDGENGKMHERLRNGLRETTAFRLISGWVELKCVEVLVDEIGEAFNGVDPLKPAFREKLDDTRRRLQDVQEHLMFLRMEVVLRDPLPEELDEMRGWLEELPAHS